MSAIDHHQASCPSFPTCECFNDQLINVEDPVRTAIHLLVQLTFGERELRVVHLGNETQTRMCDHLTKLEKNAVINKVE